MMARVPLVLLLFALVLAACGDDAGTSSDLKSDIRYVRSGGIAGDHVELVVRTDGEGTLKSRRGGEKGFTLTPEEMTDLNREAAGFEAGELIERKPAPDAFVYAVTYDGKTARTDDPNLSMSPITPLIRVLEKIISARA